MGKKLGATELGTGTSSKGGETGKVPAFQMQEVQSRSELQGARPGVALWFDNTRALDVQRGLRWHTISPRPI